MFMQFSKTRMCKFEQKGMCTKGSRCPFAHSDVELQSQPDLSCTKLCMALRKTGRCDDPRCSYAHHEQELRTTSNVYKTKMCRYAQTGNCRLGSSCGFAHADDELHCQVADGADETGSTTASSDDHKENTSCKSTGLTVDYGKQDLLAWLNGGSNVQEAYAPQQWEQNHHQPHQQRSWDGQKSRNKSGGQPMKLDDIMNKFGTPYQPDGAWKSMPPYTASDSYHNMPSMPLPLWVAPDCTPANDPWALPCDICAKPLNKDDIWYIDDTFLLNSFGKAPANVDEWSDFLKVKKSFSDNEPQKVQPSCLST